MGTDAQRAKLYSTVQEHWGEEVADAMMEVLPAGDPAELARRVDVENMGLRLEAKFGALEAKFGKLEGRFGELEGKFGALEGRFGALEGKVGELSGRVDSQFGRMITVNVGTMLAFGSVVLAAAKLF